MFCFHGMRPIVVNPDIEELLMMTPTRGWHLLNFIFHAEEHAPQTGRHHTVKVFNRLLVEWLWDCTNQRYYEAISNRPKA